MEKCLLSEFQSGFRTHHSISIALLKITNDWLIATDERLVSLLVLLDLSKAFDSVNHHLLCSKLSDQFGFTTSAVSLIMSYLSDRSPVCADRRCFIGCSSHNVGCCAGLCSWPSAIFHTQKIIRPVLGHMYDQ
jgi:hypothetical protein